MMALQEQERYGQCSRAIAELSSPGIGSTCASTNRIFIAMTIDLTPDSVGRQARYREIAEGLRRKIMSGVYRPGDKLPTELELAHLHGVSRVTSAAALAALAREGLVERAPRRGTVVRPHAKRDTTAVRPLLAWIQPSVDHAFGLDLFRGIEHAARVNGFNLLVRLT